MDVPPVEPAGGATQPGDRQSSAGSDLPFLLGQRVYARVLQALPGGQAVVDVGGHRMLASTPIAVTDGQVLNVTIRALAPVVELAVEEPPVRFSDWGYAMAAVMQARSAPSAGARVGTSDIGVLLGALERLHWGREIGAPAPRAQLASLLLPLPVTRDAAATAEALRNRLLNSGVFLEARLALLAERTSPGAPPPTDLVHDDARWLLSALAPETAGEPALERIRTALLDELGTRQIETLYHRLKEGEFRADVPVFVGQTQTDVHLRVRRDRQDGDRPEGDGGRVVELALAHPELGPVHVALRWTPGDLYVRVAVTDEAAAGALRGHVAELSTRLREAGFGRVGVSVDVDPHAATGPHDPQPGPDDPLPGGSILDARV